MKVVIAVDSLKGSLSSVEAGLAVRKGILRAHPEAETVVKPLADGGEGTTEALVQGLGGERVDVTVTGPYGVPVRAYYGLLPETGTAVMEMAQAAGITLSEERNPLRASTRGVGEMVRDALARGVRDFLIGIGGSATNDGGVGMLSALGYRFLTAEGESAGEGAEALGKIGRILPPDDEVREMLAASTLRIACDVTNPLCGPSGATYVYGPQKGLMAGQLPQVDADMEHFAAVSAAFLGADRREAPGTGAAGGLGFAFRAYLGAELVPGVPLVLDAIGLDRELADADYLVTGEGRLDGQTVMGKAPIGAAQAAKRHGVRVIAFAGSVAEDAGACNEAGIDAFFPIVRGVTTLAEAMWPANARANMSAAAEQVFRLLG